MKKAKSPKKGAEEIEQEDEPIDGGIPASDEGLAPPPRDRDDNIEVDYDDLDTARNFDGTIVLFYFILDCQLKKKKREIENEMAAIKQS